jgi:hypothetical protein
LAGSASALGSSFRTNIAATAVGWLAVKIVAREYVRSAGLGDRDTNRSLWPPLGITIHTDHARHWDRDNPGSS